MKIMQSEPPERYWTAASIAFLSEKFDHPSDRSQQDWPFEVADHGLLEAYLALYDDPTLDEDVRFTLADLIIQAFEDGSDLSTDPRWTKFLGQLAANFRIHAWQVWQWAANDVPEADRWNVSPWMRALLQSRTES